MALRAFVLSSLLAGAFGSRMDADSGSFDEVALSKVKCCCKSWTDGKPECEKSSEQHYHGCLAFQKEKPKCCKLMDKCEARSSWRAKFRFEAAHNLCTGELDTSQSKVKPTPAPPPTSKAEKSAAPADDLDAFLASLDMDEPPQFFQAVNTHPNKDPTRMSRDYTIIVDRSGSMMGQEETYVPQKVANKTFGRYREGQQTLSLWDEAEAALMFLADAAVREDPDGISLIFFDWEVTSYENVQSGDTVMSYFRQNAPRRGTTNTADALAEAVQPDTLGRAETILVITDGKPNDQNAVESEIVKAARQLCRDEDLSITFIQVGADMGAQRFLKYLDDNLEDKYGIFDIVDTMSKETMQQHSFLDVIALSIED